MTVKLVLGDCLEILPTLAAGSVDAVVTDPPYGLEFMGKEWDRLWATRDSRENPLPNNDNGGGRTTNPFLAAAVNKYQGGAAAQDWHYRWAVQVLRVAKPGAHLLAFGGTRTFHRLACAIEDAGWEIRDTVMWVYGSGFPKSLDVSKAIDKAAGAEREDAVPGGHIGISTNGGDRRNGNAQAWHTQEMHGQINKGSMTRGTPATPEAAAWSGWGTALKPAWEPIIVARKPLEGTVAANVLKWGTGAINVDGCRVPTDGRPHREKLADLPSNGIYGEGLNGSRAIGETTLGRWPANLIHDGSDEVLAGFPQVGGGSRFVPAGAVPRIAAKFPTSKGWNSNNLDPTATQSPNNYGDSGSAARFFYCAKASRADRDEGLDNTCTVKYNVPITGGALCKDVTTALVESLKRATSELTLKWLTAESGESIMGLCPSATLSTTLTAISRIMTSQILHSLTPSLISAFTQAVNCETENGGNPAESAENSSESKQTTTSASQESAPGASRVVSEMLLTISDGGNWKPLKNIHSTVKPTALMRYLCRLVTPPGGVILDPFMGSGSTGKAARLEGFAFIGIEIDSEYLEIAKQRIEQAQAQMVLPLEVTA